MTGVAVPEPTGEPRALSLGVAFAEPKNLGSLLPSPAVGGSACSRKAALA